MNAANEAQKLHKDICAYLKSGSAFPDGTVSVEMIETHASYVFLGQSLVYKIKRPIHFTYMDFSTLEKRRENCIREIEINQALTPDIYLGLSVITKTADGFFEIDGDGEPVEYAVKMLRFPQKDILFEVAINNQLDDELAAALGQFVGCYHNNLKPLTFVKEGKSFEAVINGLEKSFAALNKVPADFDTHSFIENVRDLYASLSNQLDIRGARGMVRHCHGDLHLNNIVLIDGKPHPFDALEFDENLANIDVLYDLSFLLMDLLQLGLKHPANIVFNRYILEAWDLISFEGSRVLPLFLALRAGIRALVILQKSNSDIFQAQHYLDFSNFALHPISPSLLVVCGLSGSGKSSLAHVLAPEIGRVFGAALIRSDLERKKLFGVSDYEVLSPEYYDKSSSVEVYNKMFEKAQVLLMQGQAVILDAVFLSKDERDKAERLADDLDVPFCGLHLEAPLDLLLDRVNQRVHDASDAGPEVVKTQYGLYSDQAEFKSEKWYRIDASGSKESTLQFAEKILQRKGFFLR